MANLTDPLIRAVHGTDPQNLMEYITRQKIYDSRFWKEECFGLTAADVLERAAKTLKCIGGSYGGNLRPTKFLCLTLKLLQIQPDAELVQEFIRQDHFKYVKALGAFYLRLTGRPAEIYEELEPLYKDYSKLKYRGISEWKLIHMDEFKDELMTKPFACGIALPRLPFRETLQEAGYLDDGPRPTALQEAIEQAGGLEEYLRYKARVEKSPAAIEMLEKRTGKSKDKISASKSLQVESEVKPSTTSRDQEEVEEGEEVDDSRLQPPANSGGDDPQKKRKLHDSKAEKSKKLKYGTLFKKEKKKAKKDRSRTSASQPEEGSEEYWNEQRAKLGLKPLK